MQEKQARTIWNFEIRSGENPYKSRIFSGENGQSQRAFRVSPVMTTSIPLRVCQTRSEHLEPQKRGKTKMLERRVRTAKYLVFRTRENPWKQRETGGRKSLSRGGFRVSPVMTTSIPLRVFIFTSALKKTSEKGENWWRELRDIYFSMIAEKPHKIKVFQRWASKKGIRFRVLHLRPLGQLSKYRRQIAPPFCYR